jgi:outer membrane protein
MRTLLTILALISIISIQSSGQSLDSYITSGLSNNIVLQQKQVGLEKAMLSLKIANGMFMPSVGLQGNYTSGDGGRSISLPVGDMLNPVYQTLNQLTESSAFPQIENVEQNFFPKDFYDVRVRASAPILNSDLIYNKKIQQQQLVLQEYEVEVYKRELVKNIKVAYYNYRSAFEAIRIYESALTRAAESKRVNESLLQNGRGLAAYVIRSESELEIIKAHITEAKNNAKNAKMYFNFLLNRDSAEEIVTDEPSASYEDEINSTLAQNTSITQREELAQLRQLSSINENVLRSKQFFWSPKMSAFADIGSQAENWKFNGQSKYYLLGVQVEVPLFAGFTNRHKIQQARLDINNSRLATSQATRQLEMSKEIARNAVESALQNHASAKAQLDAAESYMRLIEKGYKEGVNTFIESIDARNQLTSAQLQVAINRYRLLIAQANFERETSSFKFN